MLFRIKIAGFAIASGLALSAFPGSAQTLREVPIGLSSSSLGPAAPRVAKELGLFAKRGLDPRFIIMDSGNAAATALISGSINFVMAGSGELVPALARGQKIVMVANGYSGLATTMILSKAAAAKVGVSPTASPAERLKAMEGLIIGAPSATSASTVAFRIAAAKNGANNVRFTYMTQPAMVAAISTGAIDGFLASAPFWAGPLISVTGIVWISGPKGEIPADATPASSVQLQAMKEFTEKNRDLVNAMRAVFADLREAIDKRPDEVKAAVSRLFPDIDPKTLDILYQSESIAWNARPMTPQDVLREIAFVKLGGAQIPGIDSIDPAAVIFE